ncbi:PAS domain-containing protein [Massilia sp. B-10]|nr:PAS domain-containing protein [Massilia sp. B-10]
MSTNEPSPSGFEPEGPGREALDTLYRFVAALELTPTVAVHSIDQDGLVRFWNHSCEDIFGISARDAIGQPLTSLVDHLERETEFEETVATIWQTHRAAAAATGTCGAGTARTYGPTRPTFPSCATVAPASVLHGSRYQ